MLKLSRNFIGSFLKRINVNVKLKFRGEVVGTQLAGVIYFDTSPVDNYSVFA